LRRCCYRWIPTTAGGRVQQQLARSACTLLAARHILGPPHPLLNTHQGYRPCNVPNELIEQISSVVEAKAFLHVVRPPRTAAASALCLCCPPGAPIYTHKC
jgi:hypothetical protein